MKKCKSQRDLPWLNHNIKSRMRKRRKLYDTAKQINTKEAWDAYRKLRNKVNKMLETAHEEYRTRILDTAFSGRQRQFWKYIRAMKKSTSSIPTLTVNDHTITSAKDKAIA